MKNQNKANSGIRRGFLFGMIGFVALVAALVMTFRPGAARTAVSQAAAEPVESAASTVHPSVRVPFAPRSGDAGQVPAQPAGSRRWSGVTRSSTVGIGGQSAAPDAAGEAFGLSQFRGIPTFDYQSKGERILGVLRDAIAQPDPVQPAVPRATASAATASSASSATKAARATQPDSLQPAKASGIPAQRDMASVAVAPSQPANAPSAGSSAPVVFGSQVRSPSSSVPQDLASGAGVVRVDRAPTAKSSVFAGQVSQASDVLNRLGLDSVDNAVEAFRQGGPIRRACVEELRLKRIALIVEARQQEGR